MSVYEDYSTVSEEYDKSRLPFAIDLIRMILRKRFGYDLSKVHLLDAGCGTANHSYLLLRDGLGKATLLDGNEHMLKVAKEKVKEFGAAVVLDRVNFIHKRLPNTELPRSTFDVVMCNLVLHHLEGPDPIGTNHAGFRSGIKEFRDLLKPNGIVINTTLNWTQACDSYWFMILSDGRHDGSVVSNMFPEPLNAIEYIKNTGFDNIEFYCPLSEKLTSDKEYYNYEGIFDKKWRDLISCFAKLGDVVVKRIQEKYTDLKQRGEWENFMEKAEALRLKNGQAFVWTATKP